MKFGNDTVRWHFLKVCTYEVHGIKGRERGGRESNSTLLQLRKDCVSKVIRMTREGGFRSPFEDSANKTMALIVLEGWKGAKS